MKQQEITTLKLIESLEQDPAQTQRDLAKELNISLGLVNTFLKRLIHKGYFKVKTIPRNRIKYILTPKGMYEKTRLTYQYVSYSLKFYKETRVKMKLLYDQLFEQGMKRIFIIGTDELAEIALITLEESNLTLAGIIDNERIGERFLGVLVTDFPTIEKVYKKDVAIVTKKYTGHKAQCLVEAYFSINNIVDLSKINASHR